MRIVAVIPARMGATRLPGKPLLKETGKYLIQHVFEGIAASSALSEVLVATDDKRIAAAAASFGARAVMTSPDHRSGTDRVHEAVAGLSPAPDIVINMQGDEPGAGPPEIDALLAALLDNGEADISTLAVEAGPEAGPNPARVKVVIDSKGKALYFSRSPVPHFRNRPAPGYLVHVGMYCFRREALVRFVSLPKSPLEAAESLEQLRALEGGLGIFVGRVSRAPCSIDTAEDYAAFVERIRPAGRSDGVLK